MALIDGIKVTDQKKSDVCSGLHPDANGNVSLGKARQFVDGNGNGILGEDADYALFQNKYRDTYKKEPTMTESAFKTCASYVSKISGIPKKAMIAGHSYIGAPNPDFTVEFAQDFLFGLTNEQRLEMYDKGEADHGYQFGTDRSKDVAVVKSRPYKVEIKTLGKKPNKVRLELTVPSRHPRIPYQVIRTVEVDRTEITQRGFDLIAKNDNTNKVLSTGLRDYLWQFVIQEGAFK